MPGVQHLTIGAEDGDQRLDRWFRRMFPQVTHGRLEKMLRKGEVRIDGARARAASRLAAGQSVRVPPIPDDPAPAARLESAPVAAAEARMSETDAAFIRSLVIYRDAHIIALNKPPGLPVQGGSGVMRHVDGLAAALKFDRDDAPRLVHRLDRDTSGVLVLARSVPAARALAKAFRARATQKIYWAVVNGVPKPRQGAIRFGLVKQAGHGPHGAGEKMVCVHPDEVERVEGAKHATTGYAVIESAAGRAAWVAMRLVTGRTHQLRAHMAGIGRPIVGDGKYGGNAIGNDGAGWGAQMGGEVSRKLHLHARSLSMPHPMEPNRALSLTAPLPEHMIRTWTMFGWRPEDAPDDLFEDFEI